MLFYLQGAGRLLEANMLRSHDQLNTTRSLSSFQETSQRILRYGNSFPSNLSWSLKANSHRTDKRQQTPTN